MELSRNSMSQGGYEKMRSFKLSMIFSLLLGIALRIEDFDAVEIHKSFGYQIFPHLVNLRKPFNISFMIWPPSCFLRFDGVEIHSAFGHLIEQFMKDSVNGRTDRYGVSIANRCLFALEVIQAAINEIRSDRVGVHFSLYSSCLDCWDSDPDALGLHVPSMNELGVLYFSMVKPEVVNVDGKVQIPLKLLRFRKAIC